MHATFKAIFESAFAAATSVNLSLDYQTCTTEFISDFTSLFGCGSDFSERSSDAEFFEKFLGLVFVNVHGE
jgi:hypothetical protein